MAKYRKKPVVIEARKLEATKESIRDIEDWCGGTHGPDSVIIHTLEGNMVANIGDYVIKGVNGEFYPCKPDIFEKTYEAVEDASDEDEDEFTANMAEDAEMCSAGMAIDCSDCACHICRAGQG